MEIANASVQADEDDEVGAGDSQAAMLEAQIDPVEWKRELERVGPRLKVRKRALDAVETSLLIWCQLFCPYLSCCKCLRSVIACCSSTGCEA